MVALSRIPWRSRFGGCPVGLIAWHAVRDVLPLAGEALEEEVAHIDHANVSMHFSGSSSLVGCRLFLLVW